MWFTLSVIMKKNLIVVTGMMIGIQPLTLLYNPGTWLLTDRLFGKLQKPVTVGIFADIEMADGLWNCNKNTKSLKGKCLFTCCNLMNILSRKNCSKCFSIEELPFYISRWNSCEVGLCIICCDILWYFDWVKGILINCKSAQISAISSPSKN